MAGRNQAEGVFEYEKKKSLLDVMKDEECDCG